MFFSPLALTIPYLQLIELMMNSGSNFIVVKHFDILILDVYRSKLDDAVLCSALKYFSILRPHVGSAEMQGPGLSNQIWSSNHYTSICLPNVFGTSTHIQYIHDVMQRPAKTKLRSRRTPYFNFTFHVREIPKACLFMESQLRRLQTIRSGLGFMYTQ